MRLLLAATVVAVAGRLLDARWHATHDEFEGAQEQLEAHWLAWFGIAAMMGVAVYALRTLQRGAPRLGHQLVLAGGALYVPVAVWHFIAHANHVDPEIAHVLLTVANVTILTGAIVALARARANHPSTSPPRT